MRAVVQRVTQAKVTVDGQVVGEIGKGLLVFLGVGQIDHEKDMVYLANKILGLRIFEDESGKMNLSVKDVNGALLVVSQFTLYGDVRKGKRPGYDKAAPPETANLLYKDFVDYCKTQDIQVETGMFQAHMDVALINDGPVTLLLDSSKLF